MSTLRLCLKTVTQGPGPSQTTSLISSVSTSRSKPTMALVVERTFLFSVSGFFQRALGCSSSCEGVSGGMINATRGIAEDGV
jgi:hypothetical protein